MSPYTASSEKRTNVKSSLNESKPNETVTEEEQDEKSSVRRKIKK